MLLTTTSLVSSPVASMNEERAKAAFDIRALTILMDGGEKNTNVRNNFCNALQFVAKYKVYV